MKRKFLLSNLSLVTALMLAAFWTGRSFASGGCFPDTNGHWAETFICWLKDNSITSGFADGTYKPENGVTRAEMSVFLQKVFNLADASAQTKANTAETNAKAYADLLVNEPPATGEIVINSGGHSWEYMGIQPSTLTIDRHYIYVNLYSSASGLAWFGITPDFPSVLYGHQLNVTGMEFCYTAKPNAYIYSVQVGHINQTQDTYGDYTMLIHDYTKRTDKACRYYSFTPTTVDNNTILSVQIGVVWNSAGAGEGEKASLGRVAFFFQPTTTPAPAPPAAEVVSPEAPEQDILPLEP